MRASYIISYDITDPKRLSKVHKKMRGYGDPLQYSVFFCVLTHKEKLQLSSKLLQIIDQREDKVMIISLGVKKPKTAIEFLGRRTTISTARHVVIV